MKAIPVKLITLIAILSGSSLLAQQQGAVADQCPANATKLCDLSELDTQPKPVLRKQPLYPAELKAGRISGDVVLSFVVDVDGSVKDMSVEKATDKAFGEAAIAAVSAWKFEPGIKNGAPVRCRLSQPLRFKLAD